MSKEKTVFFAEVTDTFGGEANYSWVHRFKVHASSARGAIGLVSREMGYSFRHEYGTADDGARYNARGACVCAFVSYWDEDSHGSYSYTRELGAEDGPAVTLRRVNIEVPYVKRGRPGYRWTSGYLIIGADGTEHHPAMKRRDVFKSARDIFGANVRFQIEG